MRFVPELEGINEELDKPEAAVLQKLALRDQKLVRFKVRKEILSIAIWNPKILIAC
jgi:hypothetical protein